MHTKIKNSLLYVVFLGLFLVWGGGSFAQENYTYDYYFDKYDIKVVHNAAVDLAYPAWAQPNTKQDITDLSYWVNEVLPFEQDKDAAMYLVYPKAGIVLPITQPSYEDQRLIASGKMFDHYPYLEQAGLFYYGESPDHGKSNMVIAAHSSFDKQQPGRYKTVFQALPISRAGDKIFLYIKNEQGSYDFYEYIIEKSFETAASDVSILKETPNEYTLTTYGCYIIGSNIDRRANVATLNQKKIAHSDIRMHAAAPEKETTAPIYIAKPKTTAEPIVQKVELIATPEHQAAIEKETTTTKATTTKKTTTKSTIQTSSIKSNIYAVLKARNQYVIADTIPAAALRARLLARIQKAPVNKVTTITTDTHTLIVYKAIVKKVAGDPALADKLVSKLKVLIKKLDGVQSKEKELTFMKNLLTALEDYTSKKNTKTTTKTDTATIQATDEKVTILEDGRRFMSK